MKLPADSWSFFACSVPLRTCCVGPSSGWISATRSASCTPGLDADRVELAGLVEELLRGRLVEDREGRATDADVRELGDPADPHLTGRAERLNADPVADVEAVARGRRLVDHDLAVAVRPASLGQLGWVERLAGGRDREAERRRAA